MRSRRFSFGSATRLALPIALAAQFALHVPADAQPKTDAGGCGWSILVPEVDATGGAAPYGRVVHSAIVDPVRNRLVIHGGDGVETDDHIVTKGDVWSLSLDSLNWTRLLPTAPIPGPRRQHTAIYDSLHERMIVFGGVAFRDTTRTAYWPDDSATVWSLPLNEAPAWSALPAQAVLSRRYAHAAVYDPVRQRMWVYGGAVQFGSLNFSPQLAYFDLAGSSGWTIVTPTGTAPPGLVEHVMVYDSSRDRLLLFGGIAASTAAPMRDVWQLALSNPPTWTKLDVAGTPPQSTTDIRAVYDPLGDQMIIDSPTETQALTLGNGPTWRPPLAHAVRYTPALAYDPTAARVLAMGGEDLVADFNSVVELHPSPTVRWSATPPEAGSVTITYNGDCPETATLTALPLHGWDFASWSGDATGSDSVLVVGLDAQKTVVAHFSVSTATLISRFDATRTGAGVELRWTFGDAARVRTTALERRVAGGAPWQTLALVIRTEAGSQVALDESAAPESDYEYRLRVSLDTGEEVVAGPVRSAGIAMANRSTIESITPNPSFGPTTIGFALARDGPARLVVLDVAGREVAELASGDLLRGRHEIAWDGTARGRALPAGLYFARLTAAGGECVVRFARAR